MLPTLPPYYPTIRERILFAAHALDHQGIQQFTASQLVVAAWEVQRATFGLEGFETRYPDNNKVLSYLMGEKGLVSKNLLARIAPKVYAMTERGRRMVARLNGTAEERDTETTPRLTLASEKFLDHCQESEAYKLFDNKLSLSFAMAARLWSMDANCFGKHVDDTIKGFGTRLALLESEVADHDCLTAQGVQVSDGAVRIIRNIHAYLLDRFERHLHLMRSRK